MFLDNIFAKSLLWLSHIQAELAEDKAKTYAENEKARKERIAQDLLEALLQASSGSADAIAGIYKLVFDKELKNDSGYWAELYKDALKADAHKMSLSEKRKAASVLPGFSLSTVEHEKLLAGLGFSISDGANYNMSDLKRLLEQKRQVA